LERLVCLAPLAFQASALLGVASALCNPADVRPLVADMVSVSARGGPY
jgi:hypothetical protein